MWTPSDIIEAREDRGWTQPEAAKAVGVSLRTWSDWETGKARPSNRGNKLNLTSLERVFGNNDPTHAKGQLRLLEQMAKENLARAQKTVKALEEALAHARDEEHTAQAILTQVKDMRPKRKTGSELIDTDSGVMISMPREHHEHHESHTV